MHLILIFACLTFAVQIIERKSAMHMHGINNIYYGIFELIVRYIMGGRNKMLWF